MTPQGDLFDGHTDPLPRDREFPEGFRYEPNLIGVMEEEGLLLRIRELAFREFDFHGYKGKRRVISFGWQYDFTARQLRKVEDIPDFLLDVREVAASFAKLEVTLLQHVLVTEYSAGAGIGWHRD